MSYRRWHLVALSGFSCALMVPASAQQPPSAPAAPPACLHGAAETSADRGRRLDATRAAAAIESFNDRPVRYQQRQTFQGEPLRPIGPPERVAPSVPEWWWSTIDVARDYAGPFRDTIRRMVWGSTEPIPGWRIEWRIEEDWYRFRLIDTRDPCAFSVGPDAPRDIAPPSPPPTAIG